MSADPALVPPVALLAYAADDPSVAAFWPMAEFSPEWQAMAWARRREDPVEVRCIDLPAAMLLAWDAAGEDGDAGSEGEGAKTRMWSLHELPSESAACRVAQPMECVNGVNAIGIVTARRQQKRYGAPRA